MEDRLLVWKFKRGSTKAFRCIYDKYKSHMLRVSTSLLTDKSVAEDVVHDVVVSLAQSAQSIKVSGNLKSFLATCVANRARNINNRCRLHGTAALIQAESMESKSPRPEQWIVNNEDLNRLNDALSQLPYDQREVITLYLYGGIKFRKIAQMQQASINTIQSRYHYGLDKLRSLLNSEVEK